MRSLVGPVPEPAERAGSALRRCGRGTLTFGADVSAIRPAAADTAARPNEGTTPVTADVRLAHHAPGTADVWVAVPMADAAMITRGVVHARLEVLDVIIGRVADGRCRRVVVVEGSAELPGIRAQRHVATHIAEELPDSVLLGVGGDVALVRLRADRIVLTDHDGVADIAPDDLATSGPDPFADLEGHWLEHLNDPRCRIVPRIAMRVCRCLPAQRPLLVGIDRAGVDLEFTDRDDTIHRQRLPFAEACTDVAELGTQIRLLAGGPRYPLDRAALRP
ncbi:MAG TPA: hypothetical protein H9755_04420 [Candidatus Dietzia intestinigallinarum]|nr:hypothetical protein [Candidatus Dietzia intestinigallinarum]